MARVIEPKSFAQVDSGFRLKGWHVLVSLIAFFGVVFAVNFTMMGLAISTFSGLERASPYQDGLKYNTELEAARRQDAQGWKVEARLLRDADGAARMTVDARDADGASISGLDGTVVLERPADRREDLSGTLAATGPGRYAASIEDVALGQWDVVVELMRGGERVFLSRSRMILR